MTRKSTIEEKTRVIGIRLANALIDRADEVLKKVEGLPRFLQRGPMSRNEIIREALIVGLDQLDAESDQHKGTRAKK